MIFLYKIILYFIIYSIIGWCVEMLYCRILDGKFVNRGFLYGPYCPIYGFGAIIIIKTLTPFANNIFFVFILSVLLTSLLEYITSYILEKIFDSKWWDYSHLPLNINGRVCLLNSILFGILGLIMIYIIHPYVVGIIDLLPVNYIQYLVNILVLLLCVDITLTLSSIINFKGKLQEIQSLGDILREKGYFKNQGIKINEIKENIINSNLNSSIKRFIEAFPNLKFHRLNNAFEEIKEIFENRTLKVKEKNSKKEKTDI